MATLLKSAAGPSADGQHRFEFESEHMSNYQNRSYKGTPCRLANYSLHSVTTGFPLPVAHDLGPDHKLLIMVKIELDLLSKHEHALPALLWLPEAASSTAGSGCGGGVQGSI